MQEAIETRGAIADYLMHALGIDVKIKPWDEASRMPPYLRERYSYYRMDLNDQQCLVMADRGRERNTPAVITKHLLQVAARWNGIVLYAAATLSAADRSRLVAGMVPFVIPGKQLFLFPLGIDFRERYPSPGAPPRTLSSAAQLIVLSLIFRKPWTLQNPTDMAKTLRYSKMTIGRAFGEIEAAGLARVLSVGRSKSLSFSLRGKELWNAASQFLRTPVKTETEVIELPAVGSLFVAGLSALSKYTNISEPGKVVYAARLEALPLSPSVRIHEGGVRNSTATEASLLQKWIYDPAFLTENRCVDPLSLYLSLRGINDERVEKALDQMLEGIQW
jgi:hypothetical protein